MDSGSQYSSKLPGSKGRALGLCLWCNSSLGASEGVGVFALQLVVGLLIYVFCQACPLLCMGLCDHCLQRLSRL